MYSLTSVHNNIQLNIRILQNQNFIRLKFFYMLKYSLTYNFEFVYNVNNRIIEVPYKITELLM